MPHSAFDLLATVEGKVSPRRSGDRFVTNILPLFRPVYFWHFHLFIFAGKWREKKSNKTEKAVRGKDLRTAERWDLKKKKLFLFLVHAHRK